MKRFLYFALILCLTVVITTSSIAENKINLASVIEGGRVLLSDPPKDELALYTIIDGVTGTGGLIFTVLPKTNGEDGDFSSAKSGKVLVELGGNKLNKIDEVVITAKVPTWQSSEACQIKIWVAEKEEGPFFEVGHIRLPYSGVLGTVFEPQNAKYVFLEIISFSKSKENIIIEEVEIYGEPLLVQEPDIERVVTKENVNLFEHLGLQISWDLTDFKVVNPLPHSRRDSLPRIDVKSNDITIAFNVDGYLSGRANLAGVITTPKGWEKLFLPETVYVRCYFQEGEKEWLTGSKTLFLDELANSVELTLSLGKNRSWPHGKYRVELFVGNNIPISYYFAIEEAKLDVDPSVASSVGSE